MTIETAATVMLVDTFALRIARAAVTGDNEEIARIECHIKANYQSEGVAIVRSRVGKFIALALNEIRETEYEAVEEDEPEICDNCNRVIEDESLHWIRVGVDQWRCKQEPRYFRD